MYNIRYWTLSIIDYIKVILFSEMSSKWGRGELISFTFTFVGVGIADSNREDLRGRQSGRKVICRDGLRTCRWDQKLARANLYVKAGRLVGNSVLGTYVGRGSLGHRELDSVRLLGYNRITKRTFCQPIPDQFRVGFLLVLPIG